MAWPDLDVLKLLIRYNAASLQMNTHREFLCSALCSDPMLFLDWLMHVEFIS